MTRSAAAAASDINTTTSVSPLLLGWRQTLRDLRGGELRLLVLAVVLAVAALTAVGFFANRLAYGLERDASQLLGGDAVVASDHPVGPEFTTQAQARGLRTSASAVFPSMARAADEQGGASRLVAVKAVGDGYPLRGRLQLRRAQGAAAETVAARPPRGVAWVDDAVLDALALAVGDQLLLGDASFRIERLIAVEPDRGAGFLSFAPRVLIDLEDLPATGLVQPASRISWRLAVATPPGPGGEGGAARQRIADYVRFAESHIEQDALRGLRVESLASGRPEMRQTLDRAERFLNLVALLAALLSAVAVGVAAREFAQRRLDDCAMLRVLGLPQRAIAVGYAVEFALVGLGASALGVVLGFGVHYVFIWLLAGLVGGELPLPGPWPAAFGFGVGLTLLFGFGLPPVLQLARVPPLRVIRRDLGELKPASLGVLAAGALGFSLLLLALASDLRLGLIAVGGFAAAIAAFALLAWLAVALLRRAVPRLGAGVPRWLVIATRQIAARPGFAVMQVSALAVGLLALALLVLVRTDLVASWQRATPVDAPNRFVLNLQADQEPAYRALLAAHGVRELDWYPMIRGRLVAVNGRAVAPADYAGERAQRLVEREFNLSHAAELPGYNQIAAGRWVAQEEDALSVESGIAQTLGLKLGDRLRFSVGGQPVEGRVTSLRKLDFASMRINFFVMFPKARMDGLPAGYISTFRAPPPAAAAQAAVPDALAAQPAAPAAVAASGAAGGVRASLDARIARAFPNVTLVDVTATVAQVQQVLAQVTRAVEFLFAFTLAAGLVVLLATVNASREARAREFALMRAMGAGRALLAQVQRAELLGVGALAGLLASLAALAVGWALAREVFDFDWQAPLWITPAGVAIGALLALAAGWWSLREVLRRPVVETLRRAVSE